MFIQQSISSVVYKVSRAFQALITSCGLVYEVFNFFHPFILGCFDFSFELVIMLLVNK